MKPLEKLMTNDVEEFILELANIVHENRKLREEIERLNKRNEKDYDIMKEDISFLDISIRTNHLLKRANINTIEELCNKTYFDVFRIRGLGEKSLDELIDAMEMYDLHFTNYEY
jgi:DNA-directed RNA polymerase subunit alpha